MLPKPNFNLTPRPTSVNSNGGPQSGVSWLQYNPNQSLNQQLSNNYTNYSQNYGHNSYQTYNTGFVPSLWHQNQYNTSFNMNANNVWNGFHNQNPNNMSFNHNLNQSYGKSQHNQRNDYQMKRFKNNNQNNFNTNYNQNNRKTFNCETCCRYFQTEELYNQHLSEHIVCGLDDCKFKAHPKVIESHQRMQHFCFRDRTVVKKFMNLETDEDIEKWKEERRRNFPTKDNIKRKQELKEKQRLEAIEANNQLKQIEDKTKQFNENPLTEDNEKSLDKKWKKNKKTFKSKAKPKAINTFKTNRKLTLFQKLIMNETQEENEDKIIEKVEQ